MGIAVFGAAFVDIKGYPIDQYIPSGRNAGRVIQTHGGVSRNVVEDIANLELNPTYISVVDDTGVGNDVIEKLERHGVNTKYIARTPDGLGTWVAIFNNDGDVVASISKRPNLEKINDILKEHGDKIISESDSVVVEIDMDLDILNEIFVLCEKYHKKIYAVVSNISIAMERRDLISKVSCIVCNDLEAGLLFSMDPVDLPYDELAKGLSDKIESAHIESMVVTMGEKGAVYAKRNGEYGYCPPQKVDVLDTTGAGDSFFAGVAVGLTYGKSLSESCNIGTRLASAVIATKESVSPRFKPAEFGIEV